MSISRALRRPLPARRTAAAPLLFLASSAGLLVAGATHVGVPLLHPAWSCGFFDLRIYRQTAGLVIADRPLYGVALRDGFGFTYPPIAALLFLALRLVSLTGAEVAVTLVNLLFLVLIADGTLRLGRPRISPPRGRAWLLAAVAVWAEPVTSAIGFGQVDLLVATLVIVDLTRLERSRLGGLGIGAAAALKLTPLIFLPYLVLTGRSRMAARAGAAFAGSIALSFLVLPVDARTYWGGTFAHTSRVTGHRPHAGSGPANQSLRGLLLRVVPNCPHLTVVWILLCLIVGGSGILLAARAARRGEEAWGFVLTAVSGLLVCPVSWTHHWVIALPGLLLPLRTPRSARVDAVRIAGVAATGYAASAIWLVITRHPLGAHLDAVDLVLGDLYVIAGVGVILAAAARELLAAPSRLPRSTRAVTAHIRDPRQAHIRDPQRRNPRRRNPPQRDPRPAPGSRSARGIRVIPEPGSGRYP